VSVFVDELDEVPKVHTLAEAGAEDALTIAAEPLVDLCEDVVMEIEPINSVADRVGPRVHLLVRFVFPVEVLHVMHWAVITVALKR
jgi:hypothetical protein